MLDRCIGFRFGSGFVMTCSTEESRCSLHSQCSVKQQVGEAEQEATMPMMRVIAKLPSPK